MTTDTDNQEATHDGEFEDANPPSARWCYEVWRNTPVESRKSPSQCVAWIIEQDQRRRAGCS